MDSAVLRFRRLIQFLKQAFQSRLPFFQICMAAAERGNGLIQSFVQSRPSGLVFGAQNILLVVPCRFQRVEQLKVLRLRNTTKSMIGLIS